MLRFIARKLMQPHVLKRLMVDRLNEPLHLNLLSVGVLLAGSTRTKIAWDMLPRQHTAFSMLKAADQAKRLGIRRLVGVEFGVAAGAGLLNMCDIAARVTRETGVEWEIVGFDTGKGMPPPRDYRDHPEYFAEGDFPSDPEALKRRLPSNARLVVDDIAETLQTFVADSLRPEAPLGFAAIDVDYYWSTVECLQLFSGDPRCYLPVTPVYLDDVEEDGCNPWCGELLAVNEFNRDMPLRKLSPYNFLRPTRLFRNAKWIDHMFALHVLDHPVRNEARRLAVPVRLDNPYL
jgi:hypothetical protein